MSQAQSQPDVFPLAELAMEFLLSRPGAEEPIEVAPVGPQAFGLGLDALFSSGAPVQPALDELLGLALVLAEERQSPTAAELIRSAVRNHPKAMAALGIVRVDGARVRRGAARLTGAIAHDRAPVFGAASPKGSMKVSTMVDPMAMERARSGRADQAKKSSKAPAAKPRR